MHIGVYVNVRCEVLQDFAGACKQKHTHTYIHTVQQRARRAMCIQSMDKTYSALQHSKIARTINDFRWYLMKILDARLNVHEKR